MKAKNLVRAAVLAALVFSGSCATTLDGLFKQKEIKPDSDLQITSPAEHVLTVMSTQDLYVYKLKDGDLSCLLLSAKVLPPGTQTNLGVWIVGSWDADHSAEAVSKKQLAQAMARRGMINIHTAGTIMSAVFDILDKDASLTRAVFLLHV